MDNTTKATARPCFYTIERNAITQKPISFPLVFLPNGNCFSVITVIDAELIVKAVNSHEALMATLSLLSKASSCLTLTEVECIAKNAIEQASK
jgi:hypothetical protein